MTSTPIWWSTPGDSIAHPESVQYFLDALGPLLDRPGVFVSAPTTCTRPSRRTRRSTSADRAPAVRRKAPTCPGRSSATSMGAAGWLDLNNRRGQLNAGGLDIALAGVHDSHIKRDRYEQVAGPADPAADLRLGVMHSPEPRVLDQFAADGYELLLAGHTHGGQLCLPVLRHARHQLRHRPGAGPRAAPASGRDGARPGCTSRPAWAPRRGHRPGSPAARRPPCSPWCPAIPARPPDWPRAGTVRSRARAGQPFR